MKTKRLLIVGSTLCLLFSLLWEIVPLPSMETRMKAIPLHGMRFKGIEVELTPEEQDQLGHARALKRLYVFDGKKYWVTIVDGSKNRKAVHDPSFCYHGIGQRIESESSIPLTKGEGRVIRVRGKESDFELLTWFSDGKIQFNSFFRYRMMASLRTLTFGNSGPEPFLVMVRAISSKDAPIDWTNAKTDWFPQLGL